MAPHYRTVVYSDFMAWPRVFNAVVYEFAKILAEVAEADVIAPPACELQRKRDKTINKLLWQSSRWGRTTRPPRTIGTRLDRTCDVFVFIGSIVDTLSELNNLRDWDKRSGIKIAYIVEAWAGSVPSQSAYWKILSKFDHVFLLHRNTIEPLRQAIGVPCHFLPTAVDAIEAAPITRAPRTIDVLSIGRRLETAHLRFLEMARSPDFYYDFDSIKVPDAAVHDWAQHRFLTFSKLKRAKYFVCYDHMTARGHRFAESRGDQVLPARLFEGAACGATMIGSAPRCAEFDEIFHWPDAVIALPEDPVHIPDFLQALGDEEPRLERARIAGVSECLRAHDWSHRWATMLATAGLEPLPALSRRQERLGAMAEGFVRRAAPTGPPVRAPVLSLTS